jgi:NitT/TauT family transport system permease protein
MYFSLYGRRWNSLTDHKQKINFLHKNYIQQLKNTQHKVWLYQGVIFVLFFTVWEIASHFNWIDPLLFSSPSTIAQMLIEKIKDGSLLSHLGLTLFETVISFILGTLLGTLLAVALWWSPMLSKVLDPYLVIFNAMPKVALGPIIIVAMGPGLTSIITNGIIISVIVTTIVVYTSFKEIDPNYIKVLETFNAGRMQIFKEAVLPYSFPVIISTLKVNVGLAWVGVIVGEFLVSSQGLGYLIIYGFQVFNFTLVLMSLLVIAVFATIMYKMVEFVEAKLIRDRLL